MNALLAALLVAAAPGSPAAPAPLRAGGPIARALLPVVLDGAPAVVAVAGDALVAFRADGRAVAGFPLRLPPGDPVAADPAAGDLDGDGRPDVAVVTAGGKLLVYGRGRLLPGFPASLGAPARAAPSFADVDGDGRLEVVVGDENGRLHAFRAGGREAPGWPIALGAAVTSSASSARFAGGPTLAVGCADGKVHAVALPGRKERRGFPLVTGFEVTGAPAFADLDEDGALDLVVASQDYSVYAVNERGEPLPGFPVEAGYRIYGGVAVADLDGDGHTDLAFASADGTVHAISAKGRPLAGWPAATGGRLLSAAVAGDLDRDGRPDVVALAADGTLFALSGGKPVAGFPVRTGAQDAAAAPALLDAPDGPVVAFGLPTGELHLVRAAAPGRAPALLPWPAAGRDAARGGRYALNPGSYVDVALEPAAPRAGEPLVARFRHVSADADDGAAAAAPIEWRRDGAPVAELRGRREVPAGTTRKGERWTFTVGGASPAAAPEVRIGNSRPRAARIALEPAQPTRRTPVRLRVLAPPTDPDGDRLELAIEWLLDGVPVAGEKGEVFPADRLRAGAILTARLTASDGDGPGESAIAEAQVGEAGLPAPAVTLASEAPRHDRPVAARATVAADDGEELTVRYRWFVDGAPLNVPFATAALPPGAVRKHERVRVEARAFDGTREGPPSVAEAVAVNAPPTAPGIELRPASPRRGQALRVAVTSPSRDGDGDPLAYRIRWRRNGDPVHAPGDGRELPGSLVRKGDRIEVSVTAFDGEVEGTPERAEVKVGNTPPGAPRIAIEPAVPRIGDTVRVVWLDDGDDPDGDRIEHVVVWSRDGKAVPGATGDVFPAAAMRKHARLRATAIARDGEASSPAAYAEVRVVNTPPSAPAVALEPATPVPGEPVRIQLRAAAVDRDKDPISYRYRWLRDGVAVPVPDGGAASRREPYWTTTTLLPGSEVKPGQRWAVEAQALDGDDASPVARSDEAARPAAPEPRPPPRAPDVAIEPAAPLAGVPLKAVVRGASKELTYRYAWLRDGQPANVDLAAVPPRTVKRGELWTVLVHAVDGKGESASSVAAVRIGNQRPPKPTSVTLRPDSAGTGDAIGCFVKAAERDADGDRVEVRTRWLRNGEPVVIAEGHAELPAGVVRRGERWSCEAWTSDGELESDRVRAYPLTVKNAAPGEPKLAFEPDHPRRGDPLYCRLAVAAADPDDDDVRTTYAWWRDGQPFAAPAPGFAVPAGVVKKGERWRCAATPNDGTSAGPTARLDVRVENTPPRAPRVALSPASPAEGEALRCELTAPATDADGDALRTAYVWYLNGVQQGFAAGTSELPARLVRQGDRWRCAATASDGEASGPAGSSLEVAVGPARVSKAR